MHPDFQRAMDLTKVLINAAIEVHRDKGPGLFESIYNGAWKKNWSFVRSLL
jgi:PD-(D/E)XK nuclease superfamily protein